MQHKKTSSTKGFTLLEMLTVLAIFSILTAVVLFNHGRFTNETILTNMAYEMALSIREAQIYGVSVRGESVDFDTSYGIFIPEANESNQKNEYILFADTHSDNRYNKVSCGNLGSECVTPYTFQRYIHIVGTNIKIGGIGNCTSGHKNKEMHIVFKRPNPEPVLRVDESGKVGGNFSEAEIVLRSRDGAMRYVVISNNGQISVQNESICS